MAAMQWMQAFALALALAVPCPRPEISAARLS